MARVQNTLIGRSSGSVGGATFTTWKGINVLKSKAVSVANPNTIPQQKQRNRLSFLVAIYRLIAGIVQAGFKTQAIGKSAYNVFTSENIQNALSVDDSAVVSLVPLSLKVAKGTIGNTAISSLGVPLGDDVITVNWLGALPVGGSDDDVVSILGYNATQDLWGFNTTSYVRSDLQGDAVLGVNKASSDQCYAWLFFTNPLTGEVSDSEVLGAVVPES